MNKNKLNRINKFINSIYHHSFNIVRLHTGYRNNNILFLLVIIIICIISIFIRPDLFHKLNAYPILLNIIFISSIINIVFLNFNFACRLTLTLGRGLPFFYREIKRGKVPYIKSYLLGFLFYNLLLLILSYLVIYRLYLFIINYDYVLFNILFIYNTCISYLLYRSYTVFNFSKSLYEVEPRNVYSLNLILKVLLLVLPATLLFNVLPFLSNKVNLLIETIIERNNLDILISIFILILSLLIIFIYKKGYTGKILIKFCNTTYKVDYFLLLIIISTILITLLNVLIFILSLFIEFNNIYIMVDK